jgi:hypothetical protein
MTPLIDCGTPSRRTRDPDMPPYGRAVVLIIARGVGRRRPVTLGYHPAPFY